MVQHLGVCLRGGGGGGGKGGVGWGGGPEGGLQALAGTYGSSGRRVCRCMQAATTATAGGDRKACPAEHLCCWLSHASHTSGLPVCSSQKLPLGILMLPCQPAPHALTTTRPAACASWRAKPGPPLKSFRYTVSDPCGRGAMAGRDGEEPGHAAPGLRGPTPSRGADALILSIWCETIESSCEATALVGPIVTVVNVDLWGSTSSREHTNPRTCRARSATDSGVYTVFGRQSTEIPRSL